MNIVTRTSPSTTPNATVESIGSQFVMSAGETLKRRSAKPIAMPNAKRSCPRVSSVSTSPSSPSSSAAQVAEMARARNPIESDSPRATMPRTIGSRSQRWRRRIDVIGRWTSVMTPSVFRTATDQADGPRIITPSRTAWPPIGALMRFFSLLGPAGLLEPPLEALDATAGVHELLLAGVERMELGADLHVKLRLRRPGLKLVPARAVHGGENVVGMDVRLHLNSG